MMDRDDYAKMLAEMSQFRHERNAAQQRAEQAERERDEAREYLRRITAIVDGWARISSTMPDAWDAICGVLNERDLCAAPQAQSAPTVKAEVLIGGLSLKQIVNRASDNWEKAGDMDCPRNDRDYWLHYVVGDILDIVERLVKGGAS